MKTLLDKPLLFRDPNYGKKILLFDIENTPLVSYTWGIWEQDVIEVKEEWYILCFAWKWLGEKEVHVESLHDIRGYKIDQHGDERLIRKLWDLFDQADIIIAHNGDAFDIKKANVRFLHYGMEPPSPYQTIDTLKLARKYFKFDSNKLDYLGQYLKIGRKLPHTGKHLWLGCMAGNAESWKLMCKYNKQDVVLLEKVYYKLRAWDKSPNPNLNLIYGGIFNCSKCGSNHVIRKGLGFGYSTVHKRYLCKNCGHYMKGETIKMERVLK